MTASKAVANGLKVASAKMILRPQAKQGIGALLKVFVSYRKINHAKVCLLIGLGASVIEIDGP